MIFSIYSQFIKSNFPDISRLHICVKYFIISKLIPNRIAQNDLYTFYKFQLTQHCGIQVL